MWAKREVSTDNRVCQGAAQAAVLAQADGGDRDAAVQAARASLAGQSMILAAQVPPQRRAYAEWYDWARREVGGDPERLHTATRAAMRSLVNGGSSAEAAEAAQAAVASELTPAAPGTPTAPSVGASPPSPPWQAPSEVPPVPPREQPVQPTPNNVPAEPRRIYAGFWRRLAAWAIDLVVLFVGQFLLDLVIVILILIALASTNSGIDENSVGLRVAGYVIGIVLTWLYYAGLESSAWQATLGKRAIRLVVTDRRGGRLSFGRATARYFAKYLSVLTLFIGYVIAAFTPRKQALHDLIAGTLVVRRRYLPALAVALDQVKPHDEGHATAAGEVQRA